ncbi:MAG: FapA family protein [Leptospirales bacterium]
MSDVEGHPLDRIVVVKIDPDDMAAYISFINIYDGEIPKNIIFDIISGYDIKYGLNPSLVDQAIAEFTENPKENIKKQFIVAKGMPMVPGQNGKVDIYIDEAAPVAIDDTGKADFRNIEKFRTVEKDQILAKIIPAIPGKPGYNVFGDKIAPMAVREPKLIAGENVIHNADSGELMARATGVFSKIKNTINVSEVLTISKNVGLETGNLHYEGVIKVNGNIELGAEVSSERDLFVDGIIESGSVKVGGSLHVSGGIKTRQEGLITVKSDVHATYIENSKVYADGSMKIVNAVIGSNLTCCGNINTIKDGSKIVGGEITALEHIATDFFGNMNDTHTIVSIGNHFQFQQIYERTLTVFTEKEALLKEYIEKVHAMKEYIQRMQRNLTTQKKLEFKKLFDDYKVCENEYKAVKEKLELAKNKRYFNGDVFIHVKDTLYPGVVIHHFNLIEKITQEYKHCTLRFKKGENGFTLESYAPPEYLIGETTNA